jgi:hypothetical protein
MVQCTVLQRLADVGVVTAVLSNVGWDIRPMIGKLQV